MKFFYTATVIAAALLTCEASAQSLKATSHHAPSATQFSSKAQSHKLQTLKQAPVRGQLATHGSSLRGGGAPANDECSAAEVLTLVPTADCATSLVTGNNGSSTISTGDPSCDVSTDGYQDVWYSFNSDTNSVVTVDLTNVSGMDYAFTVQPTCDPGAEIACEIGPGAPVQVAVTPNTDYYIRVFANTDWGVGGEFTLCVSYAAQAPAPANDDCTGAVNQDLAAGSSVTFTGDNTGATTGADSLGTMPAVWEMFTTTECTNLAISYCGTTPAFGNAFANLFIGCPITDFIANSSFDATSCTDGNYTIFYTAVPAGTYYYPVMMDLANDAVGPYTITVSATACAAAPVNDGCTSDADALEAGEVLTYTGTTTGATNSGDFVPGSELDGEAATVWHAFTTTECTNVTVSYCGTTPAFGNVWIILTPSCPAGDDYILASTYDFTTCVDGNATLVYTYLPAGTYYLPVMFDATDANGPYSINVSAEACAPGYCIPMSANGPSDGDFIANVTLGSINNTTGGDNAYEDYTAQSTLLAQGGSYTLSITSGTYGEDYYAAWIDFNADTIFQSSEKIGEFEGTTPGELITLPFTVPADATLGTTRLRVRGAYNAANMEPCASYSFSETEDYSVEIELGTGLQEFQASDLVIYPNPTKGDLTISGADLSGSVEFELTDMTGRVVYRHQQSMSAGQPVTLPLNGKLAQGTYTLRLISANGISSRPVMVK